MDYADPNRLNERDKLAECLLKVSKESTTLRVETRVSEIPATEVELVDKLNAKEATSTQLPTSPLGVTVEYTKTCQSEQMEDVDNVHYRHSEHDLSLFLVYVWYIQSE